MKPLFSHTHRPAATPHHLRVVVIVLVRDGERGRGPTTGGGVVTGHRHLEGSAGLIRVVCLPKGTGGRLAERAGLVWS